MLSGDFLRADWLGVRPVSRIVGTCSRAKNNDQQHARQHHGAGEGEKGTVDRVPRGIDIEFQQPQPGLKSCDDTFELRRHAATGAAPTAIQQHGNAVRTDVALEFRPLTSIGWRWCTRWPAVRSGGLAGRIGLSCIRPGEPLPDGPYPIRPKRRRARKRNLRPLHG